MDPDVKVIGALPMTFSGERELADNFIEEVKGYFRSNARVPGFNEPIRKVAITLTLIKGPKVSGWACKMGNWIDSLHPTNQNVPLVWDQFLDEFN